MQIVRDMGRIEIEEFSGKNISRIFIASSIREAEAVERILSEDGIDYAISLELYQRTGLTSRTELSGIAFYVLAGQEKYCRKLLSSKGLSHGLIVEGL